MIQHARKVPLFILLASLALQTSVHPILIRLYVDDSIVLSAFILITECIKILVCLLIYYAFHGTSKIPLRKQLSLGLYDAIPAGLVYSMQTVAGIAAQKNLSGLMYNLLNQSKLVSSASMRYFLLGIGQSRRQMSALCLLVLAAFLAVSSGSNTFLQDQSSSFFGILCALTASGLSGLSGSLSDAALQRRRRDTFLFSAQLSFFVILSTLFGLVVDLLFRGFQSDLHRIVTSGSLLRAAGLSRDSLFPPVLLPMISSVVGAILVGVIIRLLGSVRKGLAVSAGVVITGVLDSHGSLLDWRLMIAVPLATTGVILHALG